ncbi:DUF6879 family protein [Nocardia wallacei]|uniref:DUF6879 family protein n=1 Tax=Nocardia wallacei TaxID=480035 RepID=UPI0024577D4C|nr:DUF6879 family protein [Nocardia wallacei]
MIHRNTPDIFTRLFAEAHTYAWHLETQDDYGAAEGASYDPWSPLVQATVARGVQIQRTRIVTTPHSAYVEWLLSRTGSAIANGEDIRWLPRHLAGPQDQAADDCWLIDGRLVAYTLFSESGGPAGIAITTEERQVQLYRDIYLRAWKQAIKHEDYIRTEYAGRQ